jgi:hypothetical protein
MLRMTLLSGILASVVTVVVAWFMAANIQALRGADDVIVVLVLVASFAAPIALWIGSFYLFCWLLGVRRWRGLSAWRRKVGPTPAGITIASVRADFEQHIKRVYDEEISHDDGLFEHLELPSSITFEQFVRRYQTGDLDADIDHFFLEARSHPPTRDRLLAFAAASGVVPEEFLAGLIEDRDKYVATGYTETARKLDELIAQVDIRRSRNAESQKGTARANLVIGAGDSLKVGFHPLIEARSRAEGKRRLL